MNPSPFNKTLLFTCGALLLALFILRAIGVNLPRVLFAVVPAYAALSYFLYSMMRRSAEKSPARFVAAFMGAVSLKLLITVIFLGIYIYFFRDQKILIAASVFVIYISYTLVLISGLKLR